MANFTLRTTPKWNKSHMNFIALIITLLFSSAGLCNGFQPSMNAGKLDYKRSRRSSDVVSVAVARMTLKKVDTENVPDKGVKPSKGYMCRRSAVNSILTASTMGALAALISPNVAFAEAETMERGGVKLTPFNSLTFNYRGGSNPSLDASTINEPSVPYSEFLERLNADQVAFVEFLAPNGDAAYVTFKSSDSGSASPIRIGEGYPLEDPEGWSSPAFVIKAVAKRGVPYKFVVPGLANYN